MNSFHAHRTESSRAATGCSVERRSSPAAARASAAASPSGSREEGADVVINYNSDRHGAEEALAEVQALGRRGAIIRANLGTVSEVRDLVARSADALGGLDVLVNNAGIEKHAAFWDVTENDFDAVLERQPQGCVLRDPGIRAAVHRRTAALARSSTSAPCTKSWRSRTSPRIAPARAASGC